MTLSVSRLVLQAKQHEIHDIRRLAERVELVDTIGQLVHALQRERGASSIYLASGGRRFAAVRQAAADETAPVEARLRDLLEAQAEPGHGTHARMLSLMAWVLLGLGELDALRERVQSQALSAHEAVAAFSRLIAGLLELIVLEADAALHPGISRLLVAFLHLLQGLEAAGQERAVGSLMFASGRCEGPQQQRVLQLIDAQDNSLRVFQDFADATLVAQWERQQLSPGTARLERLRRTVCTTKADAPLDPQHSDAWFEVCSERISALWALQKELIARLHADCLTQVRRAEQDLENAEVLLARLRDNPPPHSHAVERFFDTLSPPDGPPSLTPPPAPPGGEAVDPSLTQLLREQAARLAAMEAELESARQALHERKTIERAKGVLMTRLGMNEVEAYRALQKTAMDQNRRLLDVAQATLALPDFAFGRSGA